MASSTKEITPHFFKVVHQQSLDDGKLMIPRKFVRNYGNDFEDSVFLKVPSGDEWRVELGRSGDDVYLGNGLEKFVKHYSVDYGHFVVFEYRSKSCFNVVLFDTSATEIDYPMLVNGNGSRTPCLDEKFKDDSVVGITLHGDNSPLLCKRKRADVAFEFASPSKLTNSATVGGDITDMVNPNKSRKTFAGNRDISNKKRRLKKVTERTHPLTRKERAQALKTAFESLKPKHPFFMVAMQPSYINKHLVIPYNFAESFLQEKVGNVALKMLGGGTWRVAFKVNYVKKKSVFKSNWNGFVRDNNLKVGDCCIFELIGGTELELKVKIYRATEYTNCSKPLANGSVTNGMKSPRCLGSRDKKQRKEIVVTGRANNVDKPSSSNGCRGVAAANSFTSTNPSFKVVVTSKNIKYNSVVGSTITTVPSSFTKGHMKGIERNTPVNLWFGKRLWSAILCNYPSSGVAFIARGGGWRKFARDNAIQAGDICIFELVQSRTNPMLLHLSVIKHVG